MWALLKGERKTLDQQLDTTNFKLQPITEREHTNEHTSELTDFTMQN